MPITITDSAQAAAELAARVENHKRTAFFGGADMLIVGGTSLVVFPQRVSSITFVAMSLSW